MSISIEYIDTGKSYRLNGHTTQVYGQTSSVSAPGYGAVASGEDVFDCSGFSYNNQYVLCRIIRFTNDSSSSETLTYRFELQAKIGGTRTTVETMARGSESMSPGGGWQYYWFFVLEPGIIDSNASLYRVRAISTADNGTMYSNFTITNCPPLPSTDITVISCTVGKSLKENGSVKQQFFGKDSGTINLNSIGYADGTSGETSFDCSNLQTGHYVCVSNLLLNIPYSISTDTVIIRLDLQGNIDGTWETLYTNTWTSQVYGGVYWSWWIVYEISSWNIWTKTNSYRVRWIWQSQGGHGDGVQEKGFSIYNLSIDDVSHKPGCLWIDDSSIYYTDTRGYKHRINSDGTSTYVGTQYAGSMWMVDSGLTNMRKLYYVSETGYIKKTHEGFRINYKRGGTASTPGTSYKGSMWVEDDCLCYVNANGEKMYMLNGDV